MTKMKQQKETWKYDWDSFLNGEKHTITQFECCGYHSFRELFKRHALRFRGVFAAIRKDEVDGVTTITFQVWPPGHSPEWVQSRDVIIGRFIR